ncbi:MAG: redox-sensing transcriptional repressor Rex [Planctomycetota bacterium]|nr:redox-sensing transcriptional repressor Rex [Planctomycetota bacterium]
MKKVSEKTISRLCLYKRILSELTQKGNRRIFSHELARISHVTAAQVRRDLMAVGYMGSPALGYDIEALTRSIEDFLAIPTTMGIALVGIGNLGRALLAYFKGPPPRFCAAFDNDPEKIDRVLHGCRCYHINALPTVAQEKQIKVAAIAVPAFTAQEVADRLVLAGISGILNFAPVPLRVPANVYLETIDMNVALDKVAFFASREAQR